jgi:putative ABC transport system permease protein
MIALYRALLILLPGDFRRRYGEDMIDLLARRMADAPSRRARIGVWTGSVVDLVGESFAERTRGVHRPASRGGTMVDGILLDTRQAMRSLIRTPMFTAIAVLTIGLGIGATTAIFSVVNGVLLRPLPFAEADRVAMVWNDNQRIGVRTDITSWTNFEDWRTARSFQSMAGYALNPLNISGEYEAERVRGAAVSIELFDVLGVRPVLGRTFTPDEMTTPELPAVVIGHGLWTRWFGASPTAVGRTIRVSGRDVEVVGVMPEGFGFPDGSEIWIPLALSEDERQARGSYFLWVVGRLADGSTIESAQAEMDAMAAALAEQYPAFLEGMGIYVQPMRDHLVGDLRPAVLVLLGAVGLVLLIACANVANLLLSRALARQHETATRAALGARSGRLLRHSLTESLGLAFLGGTVGVALAYGGVALLQATAPTDLPRLDEISVDGTVLAFALLLSLITGAAFGLVPAFQGSTRDLTAALRDESRGTVGARSGWRMRGLLVISELALSLVLLVGAALLLQSFVRLASVDREFDRRGVLHARVSVAGASYAPPEARIAFFQQVLESLRARPEVEVAAAGSDVLLDEIPNSGGVTVEGQPPEPNESRAEITIDAVTPGYFRAVGTPLVLGREFTDDDRSESTPVTIVNEAMARRYWPNESPLGKRFKFGDQQSAAPWLTVVGVAPDWRRTSPDQEARPSAYVPHTQRPSPSMIVFARTAGDPLALVGPLRQAVSSIDPAQPLVEVSTLESVLGERLAQRRLVTLVAGIFAGVAVLLALVGVYGVLSYSVAQSTREIGVRIALGGDVPQVLGMVYRRVGALVAVGLVVGLAGAGVATRVLTPMLYGVGSLDLRTFALASLLLGTVALVACYVPARRATRVDPAVALRADA